MVPPPEPPAAGAGFTRITLPADAGYLFDPAGVSLGDHAIWWDGNRLVGSPGVLFAAPGAAATVGDIGAPPAEGYDLDGVVPEPGMVLHILVPSPAGDRVYTLWIPPNQDLADDLAPILIDWRQAERALPPEPDDPPLPEAYRAIPTFDDVFVGGGDVASTNLLITVGILILLLAGGSVFNEALEENVRGWGVRTLHMPGPVGNVLSGLGAGWAALLAAWAALIPGRTWLDRLAGPALLLVITGFIYTLLEPGVGLNEESFVLFVSLVVSQGVLVLFYEGGKAWLYRTSLHVDAGLRLFPACIIIALVSVAISRIAGFQPGFVVGFVAAAVVLGQPGFSAEDRGRAWALIAGAMLGVSVVAWIASWPLHEVYEASPSVWTALPEAIAISIFVVCLEGLLFSLIPLEFMDGWRIWKWSPWAWLALFLPATFLFTQILFNAEDAYLDLIASSKSVTGAIMLVGYLGTTFGTWAYFRWRVEHPRPQREV
jgi:hypothetical protein